MTALAKDLENFERAERLVQSQSMSEMWVHHLDNMQNFGFDRMIYAATLVSGQKGWGDLDDRLVLTNYPSPVIDAFFKDSLHEEAAKVAHPTRGPGAYSWNDSYNTTGEGQDLSEAEQRHLDLCQQWDITAGYTIWFNGFGQRRKAVIGLCARKDLSQDEVDANWEIFGREVQTLCNIMHLKAATLPAPAHRDLLTSRQRQVLNLIAEGHSVQSVADTINRSPATVEKHLRLAREALNAETTANALRKAAELNQLFLVSGAG